MAIVFALLCLAFAAGNDLLFKFYARKKRSKGYFAAIVGLVWLLVTVWLPMAPESNWRMTLIWGAISGFFSITANLLLLEAMERLGAGLCSTVYRLNLVPVVIGAAVLLNESLSLIQWIGVALATAAVLAFLPRGDKAGKFVLAGFLMVLIAAFLRAGMGLSYRFGFLNGADRNMVVVVNSLFWILGGVLFAVFREKQSLKEQPHIWRYGGLSGLLVAGIVFTMAAALQYGEASIVLPIAQMSFLLTFGCSALFLHEKMTKSVWVGIVCGVGAVLLLSI